MWHVRDQGQAGPEGTSQLHEEVTQMPTVPTPARLPSHSQPVLPPRGALPEIKTEKTSFRPGLQKALHNGKVAPKSSQLQYYSISGQPWKTVVKESREGDHFGNEDCSCHEYSFLILFCYCCVFTYMCTYIYVAHTLPSLNHLSRNPWCTDFRAQYLSYRVSRRRGNPTQGLRILSWGKGSVCLGLYKG